MATTRLDVTGNYFESCNCLTACPCVFTSPPTEGECNVVLAWHIERGSLGDVKLDGLNAALFAHTPGHMLQTKWRVALYLDERADAQQQEALGKVFSGQAGGPLAALGPHIGEVMGVRSAPIEYRAEGKHRSVRIPGVTEVAIEGIAGQGGNDVTISNHPFTPVPGFPAVVSKSKRLHYSDHGYQFELSDRNGFHSPFAYRN